MLDSTMLYELTSNDNQKNTVSQYVESLLQCEGKKVCTNLSKPLNILHNKLYRNFAWDKGHLFQ